MAEEGGLEKVRATIARIEEHLKFIDSRLCGIEERMVSSEVLDQIVTRLLDRIAVDTVKPGCKVVFENMGERLRAVELSLEGLVVKMSMLTAGIAILVSIAKDFIFK